MSDEIVHTSINIPKSKKRQRIDDILESRISQHKGKILVIQPHKSQPNDSNYIIYMYFLVYKSICDGPRKCVAYFDGNLTLLLNINNRYFIHYDLLYEYSEFMTSSRNTLHGYLS